MLIMGVGGRQNGIGISTIQIPFTQLNLLVDVPFPIIPTDVPTLLSMRDMVINGLDISIQVKYLTHDKYK